MLVPKGKVCAEANKVTSLNGSQAGSPALSFMVIIMTRILMYTKRNDHKLEDHNNTLPVVCIEVLPLKSTVLRILF